MASTIIQVSLLFKKVISSAFIGSFRYASGKKVIKPKGRCRPKRYGWWVQDGADVNGGTILARQSRLRFCPGLNVGYSRGFIYAKVPGRVLITSEITNFDQDHEHVKLLSPDNTVMPMKYYHVIPKPQHCRFKLINTN